MKQLEITADCKHAGIEYKPGDTPTLPDREAAKLVGYGRAKYSPEAKPRQDPPQKRLRNTRGDTK